MEHRYDGYSNIFFIFCCFVPFLYVFLLFYFLSFLSFLLKSPEIFLIIYFPYFYSKM